MNMKRITASLMAALMLLVCLSACQKNDAGQETVTPSSEAQSDRSEDPSQQTEPQNSEAETSSDPASPDEPDENGEIMIYAHIGAHTLKIRPEENSSAEAFIALLREGDITVSMHDYGSFEKVGPLGVSLPTNDESITTEPGDVILYQGNQITIYYDTNRWSFTRLGRVQDLSQSELKEILGNGDIDVTFSLRADT